MTIFPEDLLKVLLALLIGGIIGIEREFRDKAAGFRTMIFICLGATLFTIFSSRLAEGMDPTRIAANIVVGVGFLGAGVILRDAGGRVTGLTTAATIWLTAALGTGVGGGLYMLSGIAALISFVVLWLFPKLEMAIDTVHSEATYEIATRTKVEILDSLRKDFKRSGLSAKNFRHIKIDDRLISYWFAWGPAKAHRRMMERLLENMEVLEYKV